MLLAGSGSSAPPLASCGGLCDEATLAAMYVAVRAWGGHPEAYKAVMMCEAIGWVNVGSPGGA